MTIVKTCGKLYWAGEYAILEPGQLALIKAIPIYMTAEIKASNVYRLYSDMFSYSVDMRPDSSYALIQETVALVEDYLTAQGVDLRPFSIDIRGKMEREGLGALLAHILLTTNGEELSFAETWDLVKGGT